jgi:hypothetical protein
MPEYIGKTDGVYISVPKKRLIVNKICLKLNILMLYSQEENIALSTDNI